MGNIVLFTFYEEYQMIDRDAFKDLPLQKVQKISCLDKEDKVFINSRKKTTVRTKAPQRQKDPDVQRLSNQGTTKTDSCIEHFLPD